MTASTAQLSPSRLALRDYRLFQTWDIAEARERISRIMQPHELRLHRQTRPTRSHMDFLRLGHIGIGTIAFGSASIDVPPLDAYHLMIFCLSGEGTVRTQQGTVAIDRFRAVGCAPNSPLTGTFSEDCEQFVVRIERQRLEQFAGSPSIRLAPVFDLRSPQLRPLLGALRTLVTCKATLDLVRSQPNAAEVYEQLLLRLLLSAGDASTPHAPTGPHPAALRRAIAFIEAHATTEITLRDVADAAGIPERSLHELFRKSAGLTPMRFLRDTRLDHARRSLLAGHPVTQAALGAGFTHLGRFTEHFTRRFGQRPSELCRPPL